MSKARVKNGDLADYHRPPVIEVIFGVRFPPLQAWKLPHVGVFWHQIINEFPRCEHAAPISGPDLLDPITALPIPRVWLISSANDRLVQLQPGRFLFNWRRRHSAAPYPRYSTLSKRFFELFRDFCDFVAKNDLGEVDALEYELTYINHVLEQDGWRFPESVGRVVEHLAWQKERYEFLPTPVPTNWQAQFAFPEGPGVLSVKLNPAAKTREGKNLLALELSARGLPANAVLKNMQAWFAHAHRWIVRGFEDLTSDEVQTTLWGKYERR